MTKVVCLLECNNERQVVDLIDSQAKATLREWKKKAPEEALEV